MDSIASILPASTTPDTTTTQSQPTAADTQNEFLQLLVAQLKEQNPLDPQDGTAFVAQLAQFSSLEELTKIRTSMDSVQQLLSQSAASAGQPDASTGQSDAVQSN